MFPLEAMGTTAENLVDRYGISREEQDLYALASHDKAIRATDEGWMAPEIAPVSVPQRKRDPIVVSQDEGPRRGSTMEKLARLRPAFRKDGSVTAANSSTLNDGSAALLVTTAARARELGLRPRFRVVAKAAAGVDPTVMGIGPVPATKKALALAGWTIGDLDVIELNEAFASQSIAVIRELELDPARVNLHGGAIALGHPLGCSGARILTTLMGALDRTGGDRGLATLCVGVGQGVSTLIERC
jgi:acetyl-CoA acetyltransferase family protein